MDFDNLSFDKVITAEPVQIPTAPSKRRFILKSVFVDKYTTKRVRIELTPSVCSVCAFDVAEFNGIGTWDRVPEDKKKDIIRALEEHKRLVHPVKEDLIIEEDELPQDWLGKGTTL